MNKLLESGFLIVFYLDGKDYMNWFNGGLNLNYRNLISVSETGGLHSIKEKLEIINLDKLNFYSRDDADNNWKSNDKLLDINKPLIDQVFQSPYNNGFNIISTNYGKVVEYHIEVVQNID